MPPDYTTLAEFHIGLDEFLEGEYIFENVFVKDWLEASGSHTPTSEISGSSKVSQCRNISQQTQLLLMLIYFFNFKWFTF